MSRRYTPEHKATVLRILDASGGDIRLTSSRTGIPERTLRTWRRQRRSSSPAMAAATSPWRQPQWPQTRPQPATQQLTGAATNHVFGPYCRQLLNEALYLAEDLLDWAADDEMIYQEMNHLVDKLRTVLQVDTLHTYPVLDIPPLPHH